MRGIIKFILVIAIFAGAGKKITEELVFRLRYAIAEKIVKGPMSLEKLTNKLTGKHIDWEGNELLKKNTDTAPKNK